MSDITPPQIDRSKPDVSIVGAGPAGLACAIALARAGYRVIVHEQRAHVGGRFHGDFQGLENWSSDEDVLEELARNGIAASFEYRTIYSGIAFDAWGARYDVRAQAHSLLLGSPRPKPGYVGSIAAHPGPNAGGRGSFR